MSLTEDIIESLPDGRVVEVRIGTHWTAVVVEVSNQARCGLASTLMEPHDHHKNPDVPQAGTLESHSALELAQMIHSGRPSLASIATATINALLPKGSWAWAEKNAEEVIRSEGQDKKVVIIGGFPFNQSLKSHVGRLTILERDPEGSELPESAAPEVIPEADIVAITGMTFINRTMDQMIELCSKNALVLILGPSTPLSPILFDYGVDLLSGSVVMDIENVLRVLSQGANFRQLHRAGISLVTLDRDAFSSFA
jgi:uncharacterized protein (DUF4213/DUF364 family)